jgi:geranylgeranyl transferase type-2 subunit beta
MFGDIQNSFLLRLTQRLAIGLQDLEPQRASRHADFILRFQQANGGFSGRAGGADLYYTSFAVRTLALLNALDRDRCQSIAEYLRGAATIGRYNLIDLVSWFYSMITVQLAGNLGAYEGDVETLADEVCAALESFRRLDGGYAKTHEGGVGSTYHTFLAALCYELLGRSLPDSSGVVGFFLSRRREDGGFVEIAQMKRSGTNPTAAAAVMLNRFEAMDSQTASGVGLYLTQVRGLEGGFRSNTQIPFCDLLSTFTGLLTANELQQANQIDAASIRRFAEQLEQADGGFRGAAWDQEADPEYTFYGLGVLALLQAPVA